MPSSAASTAQRPGGPTSSSDSRAASLTRVRARSKAPRRSSGVMLPSTSVLQKSNVTALSAVMPGPPRARVRPAASFPAERHVLQQQIQLLDRPARVLPGALLHLVLPVGVDPPALDASAAPPLLVLERRRRQGFAEQLLEASEAERDLLLPARQAVQEVAQGVVLGHAPQAYPLCTLHKVLAANSGTRPGAGRPAGRRQSPLRDTRPVGACFAGSARAAARKERTAAVAGPASRRIRR